MQLLLHGYQRTSNSRAIIGNLFFLNLPIIADLS
jgi:hypothetical protein